MNGLEAQTCAPTCNVSGGVARIALPLISVGPRAVLPTSIGDPRPSSLDQF